MKANKSSLNKDEDSKEKVKLKEEKDEEEENDITFIELTNNKLEKNKSKEKENLEKEKKEAEDKKEREAKESEKIIKENEYEENIKKSGNYILNGKNIIKIPNFPKPDYQYENFDKKLFKIMLSIVIVWFSLLIIVNVGYYISQSIKKKNMKGIKFYNNEIRVLDDMDVLAFSKLKDDLLIAFSLDGVINLSKFYEENINEKQYKGPDPNLNNVHISIGYTDAFVDDIITHLSSAVDHMASSTFLHIHIMVADNFTLETFAKVMNMVHRINNNTEIIMYNALYYDDDFKVREDKNKNDHLFNKEYARLYAFKDIKNVSKIIMLNLDNLMIEKDLSKLYNLDVSKVYGIALSDIPKISNIEKYIKDKDKFFNADVILVNLELCQKELFFNKSMKINNNKKFYTQTEAPAQDLLNILMNNKIEFLNPKFNKINFYEKEEYKYDESKYYPWVSELIKYGEKNKNIYKKDDLLNADNDSFITNYYYEKQLGIKIKKYEDEKVKYAKINNFIK